MEKMIYFENKNHSDNFSKKSGERFYVGFECIGEGGFDTFKAYTVFKKPKSFCKRRI